MGDHQTVTVMVAELNQSDCFRTFGAGSRCSQFTGSRSMSEELYIASVHRPDSQPAETICRYLNKAAGIANRYK